MNTKWAFQIWLATALLSQSLMAQNSNSSSSSTSTSTTAGIPKRDRDQFSYRETVTIKDGSPNNVYGPEDWNLIQCPDVDVCLGWADKDPNSQGWSINSTNHCISCPATGNSCGSHHSSPVDQLRTRAVASSKDYYPCVDIHWLSYHDSSCSFDDLRNTNSLVINRHALQIIQPIDYSAQKVGGRYRIACTGQPGIGRQWGHSDFSRGFSEWWLLSHIDFKVPSEHTQEGKRYAAEIQLSHVYSVTAEVAGVDNQIGTIAIFLDVYDDADDWAELNRLICGWREAEEINRKSCGLPSIEEEYPGCYYYTRGHSVSNDTTISAQGIRHGRRLEQDNDVYIPATSAMDIMMENLYQYDIGNTSYVQQDVEFEQPNHDDFDWDAFIQQQYKQDELRKRKSRRLMNYQHVPWFNYFPMIKVRTEYYFRYSGTQTSPPCYGKLLKGGGRKQTNNWRVFKDPIRVTQRQVDEMHRLLRERIAPSSDPIRACTKDTAAATDPSNPKKVSVARPLQSNNDAHFQMFCECGNWKSHWEEDRFWCTTFKHENNTRLFDHPYNFPTNGF